MEPISHAGMWKSQLEWCKQRECRNVSGDSKNIPNFGIFFECLKKTSILSALGKLFGNMLNYRIQDFKKIFIDQFFS